MTLSSQQYANLADFSYGRDQKGNQHVDLNALVGKVVEMDDGLKYRVLAHADKPSGYQGTIFQREDTGEIVVAHRGTEFGREPLKDGVLTDGGMVFNRLNQQAEDAVELTREAQVRAEQYAHKKNVAAPEVTVTGHSLGGTLAQITAHHFDLRGETFNAYGAASLNYRIPEDPTPKVINHVMAADAVSSASPHYGQVRIYAKQSEISQLEAAGYHNNWLLDAMTQDHPVLGSVNTSHMMHNFLNVDGDYRRDVSALGDPDMRARAASNAREIENYRGDIRSIRAAASVGGDVYDVLKGGVWNAPERAYEHIRQAVQPALPAGEPARLEEAQRHQRGASLDHGGGTAVPDMRNPGHPANAKYQQAYAGVTDIDRSMGRVPDVASERLAASLTAVGAGMSSIGQVGLSRDGSKAFVVEASAAPMEARQRAHVDVASAVQRPVESSTADWQAATNQLAQESVRQQAQERNNPAVQGPVMT